MVEATWKPSEVGKGQKECSRNAFPFEGFRWDGEGFISIAHSDSVPSTQTSYLSFLLHICTFWAQFFSTWKRVNCGKTSQNFPKFLKISQISPKFPKISPHDNFFSHQYNLWYLWQIWALQVPSIFWGERVGGYTSLHDGRQKMKGGRWLESWPDKLLICLKRSLTANHARRFDPNWAVNYSGFCQLSMKIIILVYENLKNYGLQATPPFRQWYRVIF